MFRGSNTRAALHCQKRILGYVYIELNIDIDININININKYIYIYMYRYRHVRLYSIFTILFTRRNGTKQNDE